ncbi:MAG: DNRLRE domain-containing protein [Chitinophagaceae bacterium]
MKLYISMLAVLLIFIEFQPVSAVWLNLTADNDTYIYQGSPDSNYNSATELYIGNSCSPPTTCEYRTLIQFKLPSNFDRRYRVTSAILSIYSSSYSGSGFLNNVSVHSIMNSWDSGIVTWNNQPGFNATSLGVANISNNSFNYKNFNVTNYLSELSRNNAADGYYGFLFIDDVLTVGVKTGFKSKENFFGNPPVLNISYVWDAGNINGTINLTGGATNALSGSIVSVNYTSTETDISGKYSLSLLIGSYIVNISKLPEYYSNSSGLITVTSSSLNYYNATLTKKPTGTITGKVCDTYCKIEKIIVWTSIRVRWFF